MSENDTCSWCTAEVPISTLTQHPREGAFLCRDCAEEEGL